MKQFSPSIPTGLGLALAVIAGGCVVVPSGVHGYVDDGSHRHIDAGVMAALSPGRTTKGEVIAKLGSPNVVLHDGTVVVYSWTTRQEFRFLWAVFGPTDPSAAGRFGRDAEQVHFLALEFDNTGVLRAKRTNQDGRLNTRATGVAEVFE